MFRKNNNFLLLLKQGFKGIFKFKIQFIIILTLSFLATLVLSLSFNTSKKMQNHYDEVVGKVEPFDYVGSTLVGRTATNNPGSFSLKDLSVVSLNDFINNTSISLDQLEKTDNDSGTKIVNTSNFNFVFNSDAYSQQIKHSETFLTRFIDEEFYKILKWSYDNNNLSTKLLILMRNVAIKYLFDDLILFNNLKNIPDNNEASKKVGYLETTAIGLLTKNQPTFLDFIPKIEFTKIDKDNFKGIDFDYSNKGLEKAGYSSEEQMFIRYAFWTTTQIATFFLETIKKYQTEILDHNQGKGDFSDSATKAELMYEWFIGKVANDWKSNPINPEYLVTENTSYLLNIAIDQEIKNPERFLFVDKPNDEQNIRSAWINKGMKGTTSPIAIQSENNKIKAAFLIDNSQFFALENLNSIVPFIKLLEPNTNFRFFGDLSGETTQWNPADESSVNVKASILQYHIQLTSWASGYNVKFRKETIIFDSITSRKYRYVNLNGYDQHNLVILKGHEPTSIGEIALSEQFAIANKIRIGDYITIGGSVVMVTGFATDTYTFFPNADPLIPWPESKNEAIVYGSNTTLSNILQGFGDSSKNQDLAPNYFHFFLTDNKNYNFIKTKIDKRKTFVNLQMTIKKDLKNSFNFIEKQYQTSRISSSLVADSANVEKNTSGVEETFFKLVDFNDSLFRLNWTLLPIALKVFKIMSYVSSVVIAIIAIITLVVCIQKTITFNSKQIGILKSLGAEPSLISVSYICHALIIMFIVVPIAWVVGVLLQVPFAYGASTYFSIDSTKFYVDGYSFLISFFIFGLTALLSSWIVAYFICKQPVLTILSNPVKWSKSKLLDKIKQKMFKNASFSYRFSLILTSSGKKPIILLVGVVWFTSLLVSSALAIPAIANVAVNSYYKNINYSNSYKNMQPTLNSPLSKPVINYWRGNEFWDKNWVDAELKLDTSKHRYGYYQDPAGYIDSSSQSLPTPHFLYLKDDKAMKTNIEHFYTYILKNPASFLDVLGAAFGDNFFTVLGQSFNIGSIDNFLSLILRSNYETIKDFMGDTYDDKLTLDANKQKFAITFSSSITNALPQIVSYIVSSTGVDNGGGGNKNIDATWKDQILDSLLTQVPPYVKSYVNKSPSRLEQFALMFNGTTYVPKKETLVTEFMAKSNRFDNLIITGIDRSQNAFTLRNNDLNKIYLNHEQINKIEEILNETNPQTIESFSFDGLEIWNKDTLTLTLPMISNSQAQAAYDLKKNPLLKNISATARQLTFRTNNSEEQWQILPRQAWVYDDRDFVTSNLYDSPSKVLNLQKTTNDFDQTYKKMWKQNQAILKINQKNNQEAWLDVYSMDNSKFTYADLYERNELSDRAYLFNDFSLNKEGNLDASYVRPYYEYKNIKLFFPANLINENDILKSSKNSSNKKEGTYYYYTDSENEVPQSVLKAWNVEKGTKFLVIRPFDTSYADKPSEGLSRLAKGADNPYWLRYAFDKDNGPGALNYDEKAQVNYGGFEQKQNININFKSVSSFAAYDNKTLLVDANIANLILGYPLTRSYGITPYLFDMKDTDKPDYEHNKGQRPWDEMFIIHSLYNAKEEVLISKDRLNRISYLKDKDIDTYAPLRWHTGKFSNIDEPEGLTSSVSFNVIDNLGQYSLGLLYPSGLGMTTLISDQKLLSSQKAIINHVYTLTISVGSLLIIAIIITASLLIMLVGDIYISQFSRFMILMRALGYSNKNIQLYAFGWVSVFSMIAWIISIVLTHLLILLGVKILETRGIAIPNGFSAWSDIVSLLIIAFSYVGSLMVCSYKVRNEPVSIMMNQTNET